jgi:hypothetical protein
MIHIWNWSIRKKRSMLLAVPMLKETPAGKSGVCPMEIFCALYRNTGRTRREASTIMHPDFIKDWCSHGNSVGTHSIMEAPFLWSTYIYHHQLITQSRKKRALHMCLQCFVTYFVRHVTSHYNSLSVVAFSDQNSDNLKKVYLLVSCLAACQLLWLFALILILSHHDRALKCNHHHRLRFVHSTVGFLHPKLSFVICLCLWYSPLSVHGLSCSVLLHLSISLWVFPFFALCLVPNLKFSVTVCFLVFSLHVQAIVAVFLKLLLKWSSPPPWSL